MKRTLVILAAALAVSACAAEKVIAPRDPGVCFYIAQQKNGEIRNNQVAKSPNIEQCAAELERMRLRFLRMGGTNDEILGAFQGNFIFLTRQGVFTGKKFEGMRYLLMVRNKGNLVMPGALVDAPPAPEQK